MMVLLVMRIQFIRCIQHPFIVVFKKMRCQTERNETDEMFAGYIISYLTKMVDAKCDDDGVLNR